MSRIWLFRLYPVFTEIVSESDFWRWSRTSCVGSVGRSAFETPVRYEGNRANTMTRSDRAARRELTDLNQ
jgi:hypothetical protein